MAFKVNEISETSESVELQENLWLAKDGETVVPEGDPSAAFLLGSVGKRLSREDAERYGLVKGQKKQAAKSEDKQMEASANKEQAPARSKRSQKK